MPPAYIPLFLFSLLVLSFPVVTLILLKYIRTGYRVGSPEFQPYECGILPETSARGHYSAHFYLIAMLFVVCNVGTIFLFLWAILFRGWLAVHLAAFALLPMFVFLGTILVGYVWLYKKGALDLT